MEITPAQCRAARGLLGISQGDLADASGVGRRSITHFETEERGLMAKNMESVRRALEKAGVEFIAENGGGPGVRLRKRSRH